MCIAHRSSYFAIVLFLYLIQKNDMICTIYMTVVIYDAHYYKLNNLSDKLAVNISFLICILLFHCFRVINILCVCGLLAFDQKWHVPKPAFTFYNSSISRKREQYIQQPFNCIIICS